VYRPVSGRARAVLESWRDVDGGLPSRSAAALSRPGVDTKLGALRSRLDEQGQVLRRSTTRLVVRFEGETTLIHIRPPWSGWSLVSLTSVSTLSTRAAVPGLSTADSLVSPCKVEKH
jgi:hypothetical protein